MFPIPSRNTLTRLGGKARPWPQSFAAALAVGLPLIAAVLTGKIAMGGLAAFGALVILHLPALPGPIPVLRLLGCASAVPTCLVLGQLSAVWPGASLPLFGAVIAVIVAATRFAGLPPPGHTLFVLAAGSGAAAGFHAAALPALVMVPLVSAAVAIGIGWIAHSLFQPEDSAASTQTPLTGAAAPTPAGELLIEAAAFGLFAMLALAIALEIGLDRPYWVPISCVSVMRGMTLEAVWTRNLQRIAGTLAGVACTLALLALHPNQWLAVIVVMSLVLCLARTLGQNYALTVLLATPASLLIAELASINQIPDFDLLITRVIDITLGSSVGLVGGTLLRLRGTRVSG